MSFKGENGFEITLYAYAQLFIFNYCVIEKKESEEGTKKTAMRHSDTGTREEI